MRVVVVTAITVSIVTAFLGCDTPPPAAQPGTSPPLATIAPPPEPTPPPQPAPMPEAPATETVKAEVGVGKRGQSLEGNEGIYVTPVKALFRTEQRVVFEIQIPQALNLFNASEGRYPKSHEEFMEKIVQFNQIKLPELPPGHKYLYDPATHELMVERPRPATASP